MDVCCPRCPSPQPWRATGAFNAGLHQRRRAELYCETCGRTWSSGLPEAIAAGESALEAQGGDVWQPHEKQFTPAPRLVRAAPRSQDTVSRAELKQRANWNKVKFARRRDELARQGRHTS